MICGNSVLLHAGNTYPFFLPFCLLALILHFVHDVVNIFLCFLILLFIAPYNIYNGIWKTEDAQ